MDVATTPAASSDETGMAEAVPAPSPKAGTDPLRVANRLLRQRRERLQAQRQAEAARLDGQLAARPLDRATGARSEAEQQSPAAAPARSGALAVQPASSPPPNGTTPALLQASASLPDHLGWHSERVTSALREAQRLRERAAQREEAHNLAWLEQAVVDRQTVVVRGEKPSTDGDGNRQAVKNSAVSISPDIAAALLRHNLAGAGRIWLLLRHLDADGRGWISVEEARARLSTKGAPLRVCGWRQLRNLLRDGQGILWYRDDSQRNAARIWLRKPAKVALALSVERVSGHSVRVPVEDLLGGVGEARAQLYAAFHSGRAKEALHQGRPISRETIARLTGVPRRTQLEYEARAGIKVRHNYAVGERATTAGMQERAWQQGGTFRFVDSQGKQGKKGGEYVAWQMPNSYAGPHQQHSRSRNRRINHDLADLREYGGAGNGQGQVEKLYFEHGAAAGKAYNRDSSRDAYWPFAEGSVGSGIWYVLSR